MEDVSVPLGKVKERGDQQSIFSCKDTTEVCSVSPQCQIPRKKLPGRVTHADRRAASLPSAVPCAFSQPCLGSWVRGSLGLLADRTLSEQLFTAFCTWVP